jgi:phosphoenolpyruvate---glycerone phosphotransferase subunit DhaL
MFEITKTDLQAALTRAAHRLIAIKDHLNELDAAMGDGDCGLSAEKGAHGLLEFMAVNPPSDDLGKWLGLAGMAYNRAAPSSLGTIIATGLMRAGKEAFGKSSLDAVTVLQMFLAANHGIQERGKAQVGDKTIVDAMHPAALAFAASIGNNEPLEVARAAALQAAKDGLESAKALRGMKGRANWIGERTEGLVDPGTALFVAVLEAVLEP